MDSVVLDRLNFPCLIRRYEWQMLILPFIYVFCDSLKYESMLLFRILAAMLVILQALILPLLSSR
jgi:hypothetical protein